MPLELILAAVAKAATTATNSTAAAQAALSPAIPGNSTSAQALVPALQGWVTSFAINATAVTTTMDNAALDIGKAAVVFLVLAGVILWFSHVEKHLGKELVKGGIVIGLFIEFLVPLLLTIHFP